MSIATAAVVFLALSVAVIAVAARWCKPTYSGVRWSLANRVAHPTYYNTVHAVLGYRYLIDQYGNYWMLMERSLLHCIMRLQRRRVHASATLHATDLPHNRVIKQSG